MDRQDETELQRLESEDMIKGLSAKSLLLLLLLDGLCVCLPQLIAIAIIVWHFADFC